MNKPLLKVFINGHHEDERALVNLSNNKVLLHGDYYHDKIDEKIEGFLFGLKFVGCEYELYEEEEIFADNHFYDMIGFYE